MNPVVPIEKSFCKHWCPVLLKGVNYANLDLCVRSWMIPRRCIDQRATQQFSTKADVCSAFQFMFRRFLVIFSRETNLHFVSLMWGHFCLAVVLRQKCFSFQCQEIIILPHCKLSYLSNTKNCVWQYNLFTNIKSMRLRSQGKLIIKAYVRQHDTSKVIWCGQRCPPTCFPKLMHSVE